MAASPTSDSDLSCCGMEVFFSMFSFESLVLDRGNEAVTLSPSRNNVFRALSHFVGVFIVCGGSVESCLWRVIWLV